MVLRIEPREVLNYCSTSRNEMRITVIKGAMGPDNQILIQSAVAGKEAGVRQDIWDLGRRANQQVCQRRVAKREQDSPK